MKKTIIISLLSATAALFAKEPSLVLSGSDLPQETKASLVEKMNEKSKSFFYVKMSGSDSHPTDSVKILPGIGIGYRLNAGSSAIDFSASGTRGRGKGDSKVHFYTLPKVTYLHYLTPASGQSLYAGAGASWSNLKTKDAKEFEGITPNAVLGCEFNRNATVRTFAQLEVSQPAIAASRKGNFPGPLAEFSIGAGF